MSGLAIAGLAVSVGTTTMSFVQANKQKNLQKAAEQKANELLEDAKKRLDVNVYEALAIQKEPYELQREALLSQGAAGLQAGVEGSQRGAAATAGRVQMAQQAAQGGVRTAMGQEMMDLDKLVAAEDSRLLDVGMQLGLEESTDARQAARDAGNARQQALMQGIQGVGSVAQQAVAMAPLYSNNIKSQKGALGLSIGDKSLGEFQGGTVQGGRFEGQTIGLLDYQNMNNSDFRNFKSNLTPEQSLGLFSSDAYLQNLQNPFELR